MHMFVTQFVRLGFYEIFELMKKLLLSGDLGKSESNQLLKYVPTEQQITVGSVWIKRKEDPRLDPSLGGRDPTIRVVERKERNFTSIKSLEEKK